MSGTSIIAKISMSLKIECAKYIHVVNITKECLIKISISKYVRNVFKINSIKDCLIKRTRLKHSSHGNDKACQSIHGSNKHYNNTFLKFKRRHLYVPVSEVTLFQKELMIILKVKTQRSSE